MNHSVLAPGKDERLAVPSKPGDLPRTRYDLPAENRENANEPSGPSVVPTNSFYLSRLLAKIGRQTL